MARVDLLGERGRVLAAQISALQAELVSLIPEVDATGRVGMTLSSWVALNWGLTPGEARGLVGLAARLPELPKIGAAFGAGSLSLGTVSAMAAVATAELEDELLDTAEVATAGQLQTLLRKHRRQQRAEQAETGEPPAERASWWWDDDGTLRLSARFNALNGAELEAALKAAKEHGEDPRAVLDDGLRDDEQPVVTNPQALTRLAQLFLSGTVNADGVLPERFQTLVHLETNTGDDDGDGEPRVWVHGGPPLAPSALTELFCQAWWTVIATNKARPVTTTRPYRLAQPDQVRALLARDTMCRFPGCGRTAYLKAHHVQPDQYGGE